MRPPLAAQAAPFFFLSVSAVNILVQVGPSGTDTFKPLNVTANVGDSIVFQFQPSTNHSVTQSTFASPCTPLDGGLDSGYQPLNAFASPNSLPKFTVVVDDTAPLWFFCHQTTPLHHCQKFGMVFAVNADAQSSENFTAFQHNALLNVSTSSSSSASGTSGSSASSTAVPTSSASPFSLATHLPSVAPKKSTSTAPVLGGVAGALLLLTILAFVLFWARRRRHNPAFAAVSEDIEQQPAVASRTSVVEATPAQPSSPQSRETQLSLSTRFSVSTLPVMRMRLVSSPEQPVPSEIPADPEKARLQAAEQIRSIQQEIRELAEQAAVPVRRLPPTPETQSSAGASDCTNAELLDAVRVLSGEMHALKQQIGAAEVEAPPQYTASPSS